MIVIGSLRSNNKIPILKKKKKKNLLLYILFAPKKGQLRLYSVHLLFNLYETQVSLKIF